MVMWVCQAATNKLGQGTAAVHVVPRILTQSLWLRIILAWRCPGFGLLMPGNCFRSHVTYVDCTKLAPALVVHGICAASAGTTGSGLSRERKEVIIS